MSEAQVPISVQDAAERIRLADADDPRDVVHRAVACLARGGLLGAPTESGYVLAASALAPPHALVRLREAADLPANEPLLVQLRGPAEVWDWAPELSLVGERFAHRAWPGPLCLRLRDGWAGGLADQWSSETRSLIVPSGELALNCSAHPLLRNAASLTSGPIVMAPAPQAAAIDAERLAMIPGVGLVVDEGPPRSSPSPQRAVVAVEGERWEARTLGPFDRDALRRMAGGTTASQSSSRLENPNVPSIAACSPAPGPTWRRSKASGSSRSASVARLAVVVSGMAVSYSAEAFS